MRGRESERKRGRGIVVILTGVIILLIGLNEIVTVVIIIIKTVRVDQDHEAVGGSTVLDPSPVSRCPVSLHLRGEEENKKTFRFRV